MGQANEIIIPYAPRAWAQEFHETPKRWIVIVCHRRAGKTTAALNHLQRDALRTASSRFAYIAPTYKQAKNIAWDLLKFYARPIPGVEFNEVELTVRYPNGSRLTLYGADNPDSLRGIGLWGVVFDEYSQQPSNIFTEIIRPALADHRGYAIWIGTPKGKNDFWRLYSEADDAWFTLLLQASQSKIISQPELNDARKIMSEDEYQQEFECSFEAAIKGAYYSTEIAAMRTQGRIRRIFYDKALRVHTVWDLGVGANLVCGMFQRVAGEIKLIDTWQGSGDQGIIDGLTEISKRGYLFGRNFFPHDVAGREETTGKSRKDAIEELGYDCSVVPEIGVDNGIEAAKRMFSRLWVDEQQEAFLNAIPQYRREWDDAKGMFKDKPVHDFASHWADMLRYAAVSEDEMTNVKPKVVVRRPNYTGFNKRAA